MIVSSGDAKPVFNFHAEPCAQLSLNLNFTGTAPQSPPQLHQCILWLIITAESQAYRHKKLHPAFLQRPNYSKNTLQKRYLPPKPRGWLKSKLPNK